MLPIELEKAHTPGDRMKEKPELADGRLLNCMLETACWF